MKFRLTNKNDIYRVLEIIEDGKNYLKEQGIDQWQDGYPNKEVIEADIKNSCSYILEEDGTIIGTTVIGFDGESTYDKIYEGQWLSNEKYAVIHRMAVASLYRNRGISNLLMEYVERLVLDKGISSIKIDTHKRNIPMRKFLEKMGYVYCGIIFLEDGKERVAFEKNL